MPEEIPEEEKESVYERWLGALLPDPVSVGQVRLAPMTYGHALLLGRLTGWEPLVTEFRLEHLPTALYVLSRDWRTAATGIAEPEAHEFLTALARRVTLEGVVRDWVQYMSANLVLPRFRKMTRDGGHPVGAPFLLRLRLFAFRTLGFSPDELEDTGLADLVWLYLAHLEEEGGVRLTGAEDDEFEEWCKAEEKRMQTGVPGGQTAAAEGSGRGDPA